MAISRCFSAEDGSEVRPARAARLFLDIQPMKVLICGVVVAVLVVDTKGLPYYLLSVNCAASSAP